MMCQKTVLLIECDTVAYLQTKELLKKHDVILLRAFDFAEVAGIINDFVIDLVLFDVMKYPNVDTICLIEKIKKINQQLPLVVLSNNTEPDCFIRCFYAGCNDYIVKPFNLNVFHKTISKYCPVEDGVLV